MFELENYITNNYLMDLFLRIECSLEKIIIFT